MAAASRGRAPTGREAWEPLLPRAPVVFPSDFTWGVASSAFQAEGGDVPNDWADAARAGRVPPNPGNGFWERGEGDFGCVAGLGIRSYRLSVEWSRVEPERGVFDEAALDRYRALCDAAHAAGVTPWVNFFHFTQPRWFAARGGFLAPGGPSDFLRYLERAARALMPHARHYHVQNEAMIHVVASYLVGDHPPFLRDGDKALDMTRVVLQLHADGYRLLKGLDGRAQVVTIDAYLDVQPRSPREGDVRFAERFDAWYHGAPLAAFASGWLALPGREPVEIPGLPGALDAYGLNYYAPTPVPPGGPEGTGEAAGDPPRDAMGRRVDPTGLERGLRRVAEALPGVPLLVTENGCPTSDESFRIRYLAAHLAALARCREAGLPVGGYFHWTAVDNYEWRYGFGDERFGLIGFDPATRERRVKASGRWLAEVIERGRIDPDRIP